MNHKTKFSIAALCAGLTLMTGCANVEQEVKDHKEIVGTVVGGLAGGLLGSRFGGGAGRIATTLLGTAAGGFLGNKIGNHLNEKDQQSLQAHTQERINNPEPYSSEWRSNQTGQSVQVTAGPLSQRDMNVQVRHAANVQSVPSMQLLNETFHTSQNTEVHSAPSSESNVVGRIPANSTFTAVGKTGNQWLMVASNGITVGYIPASSATANKSSGLTSLDQMSEEQARANGFDTNSINRATTSQTTASVACRNLQYNMHLEGQNASNVQACRNSPNHWYTF